MSQQLHPMALFRLSVLGPLASRQSLSRGEIKTLVHQLAAQAYLIPHSHHTHVSPKTILRWYHAWRRQGIEGLSPQTRRDKGQTQLSAETQALIVQYKTDNPARSINTVIGLLEKQGLVARNSLSRSAVHRFLQQQKMSRRILADLHTIERRSFVAEHAGDIWHGDVLHGPSIQTQTGMKKIYLVSLIDDASRLLVHSAFCFGETAVDIEGVLKQAVLKRGLPHKIIIDNGAAYRSGTLQSICALLEIRLIYCPAREPQGKGKLERFHFTFRSQFLAEIDISKINGLTDINARLWAWIEQVYHQRPHEGIAGKKPIDRWREDLVKIRPLGFQATQIDNIFCHRHKRLVRKDGTVSWKGQRFEVPYEQSGEHVILVLDPHINTPLRVESLFGDSLGAATPLDKDYNLHRKRQRPTRTIRPLNKKQNMVELAYEEYQALCGIPLSNPIKKEEE